MIVLAVLGLRRDHEPRAAAPAPRARPRPGRAGLERSLHLDPELALDRWLAGHHTLGLLLSYYYDNAHFIVTLGLLGWLWWKRADLYRPLRNTLVLVNLLAFAVFWLYPVAPPRMLAASPTWWPPPMPSAGWHTGALASQANQLAAMPSLHIAWAVWCTLALWRISTRRVGARAGRPLPVRDGRRRCSPPATTSCSTSLGGLVAIAAAVAIVSLAARWRWPAEHASPLAGRHFRKNRRSSIA